MKPFIIYKELKDNKVELTKEELEKLLEDAYNQGYIAGKAEGEKIYYPYYPQLPSTPSWPATPYTPVWYSGSTTTAGTGTTCDLKG